MSIDLSKPLDRPDPAVAPLLEDLQGNILVGHGRDHTAHLFLRFDSDNIEKGKEWISSFATQCITSALKQFHELDDFRRHGLEGSLFANFFLAYKGYEALGIPPPEPRDSKLVAGMKASQEELNDPAYTEWEAGYRHEIHASILLAHNNEQVLRDRLHCILAELREFADIVTGETGQVMRNENGNIIEHFGFADGRSQPLSVSEEYETEREREPLGNTAGSQSQLKYDPRAPADLLLVPDSNGEHSWSCGSYFVFRKLEQNVRGFREAEHKLAESLKRDNELVAAQIIGRFRDGTPLVAQQEDGLTDIIPNNFNYEDDPDGDLCPLHAHIRKLNPRNGKEEDRHRRIARRGITYDSRRKQSRGGSQSEKLPTHGVGLLFMCFQSNIAEQFEYIQKEWANKEDYPGPGAGLDPIVGRLKEGGEPLAQRWPTGQGNRRRHSFLFNNYVRLKGGEYFFAPSISALKNCQ